MNYYPLGKTRGIVMFVIGAVLGAQLLQPAVAGVLTKPKVKKIAAKQANVVFDTKIGPATSGLQPQIHWAHIQADATILAQSGGISVQHSANDGEYYLHFPALVAGKGILATADWAGYGGTDTHLSVLACGSGNPFEGCIQGTDTTSDLYVETENSTNAPTDRNFYVAVFP